ncbi:hypothetical protein AAFP32_03005 [Brevibacterium sp. CBA3109]|uniref:Nucleotidyl transferase AbiEii/AbiGii toxin family protein n=1 Tax=Brevibacterium koreense TaxID=3140787 RepID=A0AAU7UMC9_9MICO
MLDLTGHTDVPVPEEVLAELADVCGKSGTEMFVIGAAARDLVIHARKQTQPVRATHDVDIAVAVRTDAQFQELSQLLTRKRSAPHKFSVLGIEVDIIPFGGNESDRTVCFADGSSLDVTGIREAHSTSVLVRLPKGTEVYVASPAALTALKILAWSERHDDNPKDGLDLAVILSALSESPFDDEVWNDDDALDATDVDIISAASYHYARIAAEPFTPHDGRVVLNIIRDQAQRSTLIRNMRTPFAEDLLEAYSRGFSAGLEL